jgi:hypothetical protein
MCNMFTPDGSTTGSTCTLRLKTSIQKQMMGHIQTLYSIRDDFFHIFNRFQLFLWKKFLKDVEHSQNRSRLTFLKGGVDGFSYFSIIFSYFIFYPELSLFNVTKVLMAALDVNLWTVLKLQLFHGCQFSTQHNHFWQLSSHC